MRRRVECLNKSAAKRSSPDDDTEVVDEAIDQLTATCVKHPYVYYDHLVLVDSFRH